MRKNAILWPIVFLTLPLIFSFSGRKKVLLRFNLNPGGVYHLKASTSTSIDINVGTQTITQQISNEMEYLLAVKKKYGQDSLSVIRRYNELVSKASVMGRNIDVNSDKIKTIKNIFKNNPITYIINDRGKVLNRYGWNNFKADIDTLPNPKIKKTLESLWQRQDRQKGYFMPYGTLPKTSIYKGKQWRDTLSTAVKIPSITRTTYTVKAIHKDNVVLAVQGDIIGAQDSTTMRGIKVPYTATGQHSGTYTISRKTGLITKGDITVDLKVKMTMMGRKFNYDTKSTTLYTGIMEQ